MNGSSAIPASPSREELVARIDSSCRVLLIPILSALVWLLLSSLFMLITSVKLHSPAVLANCSWLTYGHTRPVANDAFVYGFASQAGIAIALWILCHLGRTTLVGIVPVAIGSLFWNLGVTIGVVGILSGHSTGFEWLEFPSAGSAILIASYAVLGICALLTFKARERREVYPAQWYILAALFWFPWLYTTARLLLIWFPVRGVMQQAVNGWYANGLFTLWLAGLALAILFYFIPKLVNAPLHSRTLAVLGFWSLALFGGFSGHYRGQPLPAWMISVGIAASVVLLVPLLATASNLWLTLGEGTHPKAPLVGFFKTSVIFYALTGLFAIFAAMIPQLRLTLFGEGAEQLALYGFVGLALFGAIHYVVPRLTGVTTEKFVGVNCWATLLGVLLFAGIYIIGGMLQQKKLINGSVSFVEVMNGTKPFIRISTLGILLLIVGNAAILARVIGMVRQCCRDCCRCCADKEAPVTLKPAEAAR
jgi:cytochrome c oxidase cbb3-type subunit I